MNDKSIVTGRYGEATVYTENCDGETYAQILQMLNSPISKDAHVEIMPDCHAGAGCVIGTTMRIVDKVCPNVVGVDIGCGVLVLKLGKRDIDLEKLDNFIKQNIPNGFGINSKSDKLAEDLFDLLKCKHEITNEERITKSLGSLGGGNHFIEVDVDDEDNKYLLIHSGSRNLGLQVAKLYQHKATVDLKRKQDEETKSIISNMKAEGNQEKINDLLKNRHYKRDWGEDLDYLEGELLNAYLHDMEVAQKYAEFNRHSMAMRICAFLGIAGAVNFDTVHNYIDIKNKILRKGAVSAQVGELLIIPINMRDGALICRGKGNPEWNYSAPHGAGRILSRSEAKKTLSETEFAKQMEGVFTTTADINTIDEAPMAYKPMQEIINNIGDTVEIVKIIRPIYNFKAGE